MIHSWSIHSFILTILDLLIRPFSVHSISFGRCIRFYFDTLNDGISYHSIHSFIHSVRYSVLQEWGGGISRPISTSGGHSVLLPHRGGSFWFWNLPVHSVVHSGLTVHSLQVFYLWSPIHSFLHFISIQEIPFMEEISQCNLHSRFYIDHSWEVLFDDLPFLIISITHHFSTMIIRYSIHSIRFHSTILICCDTILHSWEVMGMGGLPPDLGGTIHSDGGCSILSGTSWGRGGHLFTYTISFLIHFYLRFYIHSTIPHSTVLHSWNACDSDHSMGVHSTIWFYSFHFYTTYHFGDWWLDYHLFILMHSFPTIPPIHFAFLFDTFHSIHYWNFTI